MKKTHEVDIYRVFLPILFIGFAIILELVNFLYLGFTNSEGNVMALPTYFLFDLLLISDYLTLGIEAKILIVRSSPHLAIGGCSEYSK